MASKELSPTQVTLLVFALGVMVLIGGIGGFLSGYQALHLALFELPNWTKVPAHVVESRVTESMESGTAEGGGSRDVDRVYRAHVTYRYEFDGRRYRSDRIRPLDISSPTRADAQALVDKYPSGRSTTAWVDPDAPAESVLERGDLTTPAFAAGLGAVFILAGIGLLVTGIVLTMRGSSGPPSSA